MARKSKTGKAKTGPESLTGSREARRIAAVVLEVLAGVLGTSEAAQILGMAPPRYYVLETRAMQGLIDALEPKPRGRKKTEASRIKDLEGEIKRLTRELRRAQSLARNATRALGLGAAKTKVEKAAKASGTKRRRGRPRGLRAAKALREGGDGEPAEG